MSEVLCDFCRGPWTGSRPMIEGHRGAVICGDCLGTALKAITENGDDAPIGEFFCIMCRESDGNRAALGREGETGWRSPDHEQAVICRRCAEQAAGALERDPNHDWGDAQAR